MSFIQAKCINCGAILEVDKTKEAAICPYCRTPYIVEKAINNYSSHSLNNYGSINAGVVNIYNNCEKKYGNSTDNKPYYKPSTSNSVQITGQIQLADSFKNAVQFYNPRPGFFGGGGIDAFIFLKSDGTLGLWGYWTNYLDPTIFTWKNIKSFILGSEVRPTIAVTFDGNCLISDCYEKPFICEWDLRNLRFDVLKKAENRFNIVKSWTNILNIYYHYNSDCIIGIKTDGSVVSCPEIAELSDWTDIQEIISCNDALFGLTSTGKVKCFGFFRTYEKNAIEQWDNVIQIIKKGDCYYGLNKEGIILGTSLDYSPLKQYRDICVISEDVAIVSDGSLLPLSPYNNEDARTLSNMGAGYCQHCGEFYLYHDGRIDHKNTYNVGNKAISIIYANPRFAGGDLLYVQNNGSLIYKGDNLHTKLFIDDPLNYRKEQSSPVPDSHTKQQLSNYYQLGIENLTTQLKRLGWGHGEEKSKLKNQIKQLNQLLEYVSAL